jgi:hypothetical protein
VAEVAETGKHENNKRGYEYDGCPQVSILVSPCGLGVLAADNSSATAVSDHV